MEDIFATNVTDRFAQRVASVPWNSILNVGCAPNRNAANPVTFKICIAQIADHCRETFRLGLQCISTGVFLYAVATLKAASVHLAGCWLKDHRAP